MKVRELKTAEGQLKALEAEHREVQGRLLMANVNLNKQMAKVALSQLAPLNLVVS